MNKSAMNRSKEEIIAAILTAANEPVNRTLIMYKARLSHTQLMAYTRYLEEKLLIHKTQTGLWIVTDIGRVYLNQYHALVRILESEPLVISQSMA
jgi:predicted transcriptional regulator